MELRKKIDFYFFDPTRSEEEYSSSYRNETNKRHVAYSPLYLLRRHILFLTAKLPENTSNYKPYFSALILSNIAIPGLMELLGFDPNSWTDENQFFMDYLGKDNGQKQGLKILRNALEHNNFMLFTRLEKARNARTRRHFQSLGDCLVDDGKLTQAQIDGIDFFKVSFSLHDSLAGVIVKPPEVERFYAEQKYALIRYHIAPFDYLQRFEQIFDLIKDKIVNSPELKANFDSTILVDNWMKVF